MMIPRDAEPLFVTPAQADKLRRLLANLDEGKIVGEAPIVVGQRGGVTSIGMRRTKAEAPVGDGGGGDLFRVRLELDPTTAALTGSATTQCGFKYFAYPADAAFPFDPNLRLPIGAASPSRIDYRGHMSVGPYVAATTNSFGHAFMDGTDLRLFAWKEQPRAEACT